MAIVTVDPGDQIPMAERPSIQFEEFLPQDQIGELVRDHTKVTIIRQRFRDVDWGDQRFEMLFVDGNHCLPQVLEDSHLALKLVTSPGVIAWHDYDNVRDVNIALGQLNVEGTIVSLHNTWIAYLVRTKHMFRQDVPCLVYAALEDASSRNVRRVSRRCEPDN
jgi:hypothetical protein